MSPTKPDLCKGRKKQVTIIHITIKTKQIILMNLFAEFLEKIPFRIFHILVLLN